MHPQCYHACVDRERVREHHGQAQQQRVGVRVHPLVRRHGQQAERRRAVDHVPAGRRRPVQRGQFLFDFFFRWKTLKLFIISVLVLKLY